MGDYLLHNIPDDFWKKYRIFIIENGYKSIRSGLLEAMKLQMQGKEVESEIEKSSSSVSIT